jgi:hypothetical protein
MAHHIRGILIIGPETKVTKVTMLINLHTFFIVCIKTPLLGIITKYNTYATEL